MSSSKILNELKEQLDINIIFNNFQAAINLESYISNSIVVTSRILDFIKNNRIKVNKIIYTSSSSVYGNNDLKPMNLHLKLLMKSLLKIFV